MGTVRIELAVLALLLGVAGLASATAVAMRAEPAVRGRRVRGVAPLVPWLGTLLVVVLLVRGATAGASVVAAATAAHAVVTRWRAVVTGRRDRRGPS